MRAMRSPAAAHAATKGGAGFLSQAQALRRSKFTTQTFVGYKTILAK
jgi:hypothetical protein